MQVLAPGMLWFCVSACLSSFQGNCLPVTLIIWWILKELLVFPLFSIFFFFMWRWGWLLPGSLDVVLESRSPMWPCYFTFYLKKKNFLLFHKIYPTTIICTLSLWEKYFVFKLITLLSSVFSSLCSVYFYSLGKCPVSLSSSSF